MIYAFGSNSAGQLGIGHTRDVSIPQPVQGSQEWHRTAQVKRIAAGGSHTLILGEDGTVRAAGNNADGRIGLAIRSEIVSPEEVMLQRDGFSSEISRFYDVSATWAASFFVAMNRRVIYVCGTALQPMSIELPDTIENIRSCLSHTVVVLSDGQIWGWGKGRKGQLGEPKQDSWTPRKIKGIPFLVTDAVCGADFTCALGARSEGQLIVLGSDQRDRFRLRADAPSAVHGWTSSMASWGSLLIQAGNKVKAWGRNDRGQLPPSHLPPVESLAAGSEHWLALTTDGRVLSGGWGEHGNCGELTDEHGVVKARWNVVSAGIPVKRIFAGCATSFLVGPAE